MSHLTAHYSVANIDIQRYQSKRFVLVAESQNERRKLLQVIFHKDGSIFVSFPYFSITNGIVSLATLSASDTPAQVPLTNGGHVTSHLVKYTHHQDGEAHFSQDAKVKTVIRKKALPLARAEGHLFTAMVQDLRAFKADSAGANRLSPLKRTTLAFPFNKQAPPALKIVGWWYPMRSIPKRVKSKQIGPQVPIQTQDGTVRQAFLVGPPVGYPLTDYMLALTCEQSPVFARDASAALLFFGGFDERARDATTETTVLFASYPALEFDTLKHTIGTIDLV